MPKGYVVQYQIIHHDPDDSEVDDVEVDDLHVCKDVKVMSGMILVVMMVVVIAIFVTGASDCHFFQ